MTSFKPLWAEIRLHSSSVTRAERRAICPGTPLANADQIARALFRCPIGQFTQFCAIRRTDPTATDALIAAVVERAKAAGLKLAGVLQRDVQRPGRRRCDMDLIDLATGRIVRISEDRGNLARGCRMNMNALVEAAEMVEETIRTGAPDLVILNKFAEAEEEGGGMRDAIAASVAAGVPVFMGVGTPLNPRHCNNSPARSSP